MYGKLSVIIFVTVLFFITNLFFYKYFNYLRIHWSAKNFTDVNHKAKARGYCWFLIKIVLHTCDLRGYFRYETRVWAHANKLLQFENSLNWAIYHLFRQEILVTNLTFSISTLKYIRKRKNSNVKKSFFKTAHIISKFVSNVRTQVAHRRRKRI